MTPIRRRSRFRPQLECLEDRSVPTATSTALAASVNPAQTGQAVTFTATITGGDFAAGSDLFVLDSVTFLDGQTKLATVTPKATGGPNHESRAQFTTSGLSAGTHAITAKYSGGFDPIMLFFNDVSTSNAVAEMVNAPPPPPTVSDVTALVSVFRVKPGHLSNPLRQQVTLRNLSATVIQGPLYLVVDGLPARVRLRNAAGFTLSHAHPGDPFLVDNVTLNPGGEIVLTLLFANPRHKRIRFSTEVLAGLGAV